MDTRLLVKDAVVQLHRDALPPAAAHRPYYGYRVHAVNGASQTVTVTRVHARVHVHVLGVLYVVKANRVSAVLASPALLYAGIATAVQPAAGWRFVRSDARPGAHGDGARKIFVNVWTGARVTTRVAYAKLPAKAMLPQPAFTPHPAAAAFVPTFTPLPAAPPAFAASTVAAA